MNDVRLSAVRLSAIGLRELAAFVLSPVGALIGAAFALLQGLSFWGLVRVLANPAEPAPYGAVLHSFFGGTLLYWAVVFAVISALTMRTYAEERQQGTWELLATSGATDLEIVFAKGLAGLLSYLLLWLPTVTFVIVIDVFAPAGSGLEFGPVLGAYLGVAIVGAALVGLGQAASALMPTQMSAGLLAFALAMASLLIAELSGLALSFRGHMHDFASGLIRWSLVVAYLGSWLSFSALVYAAIARVRRQRGERTRRWAFVASCVLAVSGASALTSTFGLESDLTQNRVHTLSEATKTVLEKLETPIEVTIVRPTIPGFSDVFVRVGDVLERMESVQPLLTVASVDPASSPELVSGLARSLSLPANQIAQGGAVVFKRGTRVRVLDVTAVADFERDPLGAGQMVSFWAESAFAGAIADVSDTQMRVACALIGLGTLPIAPMDPSSGPQNLDWALVGRVLKRDGIQVRLVDALRLTSAGATSSASNGSKGGLDGCDAVLLIGPNRAPNGDLAAMIKAASDRGAGLLVALRSQTGSPLGGLELILADAGISIRAAIALDPTANVGVPLLWATTDGYGEHPISAPFAQRGARTVWPAPRVLAVTSERATALVTGSKDSWAETDLESVFAAAPVSADRGESFGNVVVAAATITGPRMVVLASAEMAASQFVERGLGAGHLLAARSITWLVGRDREVPLADKMPEHLRLLLSPTQRSSVFVVVVIAMPAAWLLLGLALGWRRRRG